METLKATIAMNTMNITKAMKVMNTMNTTKAMKVMNTMNITKAMKVMNTMNITKAMKVMNTMNITKAMKVMNTMRIGVVDTMFSRVDYFPFVEQAINESKENKERIDVERYTVPGIKDIPVACKILFEEYHCDICIALGMPGPQQIDKQCSHEASLGIQQVQLLCNKHILEVFVHMDEAKNNRELYELCKDRAYKHTLNAIALLQGKTELTKFAGHGKRQGRKDVGGISID